MLILIINKVSGVKTVNSKHLFYKFANDIADLFIEEIIRSGYLICIKCMVARTKEVQIVLKRGTISIVYQKLKKLLSIVNVFISDL